MTETLIPLTCKLPTGERCCPRMLILDALIAAGLGDATPNGARKHGRPTVVQHRKNVREHAIKMRQVPPKQPKHPAWTALRTRKERLEYIWAAACR